MQTFDQHIYDLYASGRIDYDNALAYADSPNDLRLRIKVSGREGPNRKRPSGCGSTTLADRIEIRKR